MRKVFLFLLLTVIILGHPQKAHAMFFSNGDFETGNLNNWFVQEDFGDVPSSPQAAVVDDGTGNHVGALFGTSTGVKTITLGRDIGTMPLSADNLFFDFRNFDAGPDGGISNLSTSSFLDSFTISLLTDAGDLNPILTADNTGFTVIDPSLTTVNLLANGFYHVNTNVAGLRGADNSKLFFDLSDEIDGRLTNAWIDNLDLSEKSTSAVPEPATFVMFVGGLVGLTRSWRKRKPR